VGQRDSLAATFFYYHAPNFGDSATVFTKQLSFAGPDNFFHSRYGATMGPSLSWYRKSYYLYYMSGASAIYLEQGFDQFLSRDRANIHFSLIRSGTSPMSSYASLRSTLIRARRIRRSPFCSTRRTVGR